MRSYLENQHPKYDFSLNKAWSNVLSFASGNVQKNNIYALKEKIESGDVAGWEDVYNLLSSMDVIYMIFYLLHRVRLSRMLIMSFT
ncbi:hypothetical protein KCO_07910 [Pectobacterium brasiliense ICMP 19477]|nr:hypothetical protein KCO_07910 [Pectobacterium brasiliense ICMP 19477]